MFQLKLKNPVLLIDSGPCPLSTLETWKTVFKLDGFFYAQKLYAEHYDQCPFIYIKILFYLH